MGAVIEIKDITEGNKAQKLEALEKAFSGNPIKGIIKADNTPAMQNITLYMKDMSDKRMEKALRTLSMTLGVPSKAAKGEVFMYKAQEDLTDKWCGYFSTFVKELYEFTTDYFSLPKKTAMSKADNLVYKGKILYYPESGEPIKKADWEKFVKNLEKFLNRNNKNPAERLILQSQSLGKILNRMLKYNTLEAVKKLRLEDMMYHGKSFDWITDSVKNMKDTFGDSLTRAEQARIEMLTQSAAQKVTNVTEKVRGDIQQILIDGVRNRKSKGQVSQELFDKMVGDNRDYQRLADTEIQNAVNNSFIREEVQSAPEGEKVYFQRIEVIDGNTCPFCRQMNGKIALWSDKPLKDEKAHDGIADFVIWEGKEWNGKGHSFTTGVFHPYCRGSWVRYDKDLDNARIDALIADRSGNASKWNSAVKQATKEFEEKGVKNPDDSTKGFTDRINQIFKGDDVKKSLEESDGVFFWKRTLKTYCDRHNLNYEEAMKPFHSETIKKLCKDLGADYENAIAYITHKHLTTEQFHNDLKRQLNGIDKSLTINEKLFRLWTRRVNPEFLKEVKKIYDGNRFISRAVYNIKGYPQGQDLENCELVNLGEDYLTISCGGDWQEEKLVKIELSDNGLIAKEVEEAEKEDGHILNKKRSYILSGVNKSLTWSGHKLQGRKNFAGLKISIENRKGSIRRGVDADGHEWAIKMNYDYGYIRGTEGVDGDHLDCYLGDNEKAKKVYIIHQKIPGTKTYDEDKCMLGFNTLEDARQAYLSQYDKRGFLESIDTVDITVFKEKIFQNKYKGKRLDI